MININKICNTITILYIGNINLKLMYGIQNGYKYNVMYTASVYMTAPNIM